MRKLTHYSKDKEWAFYDDGSVAHRHKASKSVAQQMCGATQYYCLCKDGNCLECGKKQIT